MIAPVIVMVSLSVIVGLSTFWGSAHRQRPGIDRQTLRAMGYSEHAAHVVITDYGPARDLRNATDPQVKIPAWLRAGGSSSRASGS
jgi:hypothetical protein